MSCSEIETLSQELIDTCNKVEGQLLDIKFLVDHEVIAEMSSEQASIAVLNEAIHWNSLDTDC